MKIYKIIADKKPGICLLCPIKSSSVKVDMLDCGVVKTWDAGDGWTQTGKVPDHRCLFEVKE